MGGLIKESIQIMGSTYQYLPREVQLENLILGEDILSRFSVSIPIEMYLTDATGFQGDKEMFSKFGLEIRNTYKLVVHKSRWEQEVKTQFDLNITNGESAVVISDYIRPREGDLIYDPITKFLLEVKFVDHDVEFFALGKNYQYYLSCEAFQYQNEIIETGVPDIDIFASMSNDKLLNQMLMENGDAIVFEQGGYLLLEDGSITTIPMRDYGSPVLVTESVKLNLSINNPFE